MRPRWPGKRIDLRKLSAAHPEATSPFAKASAWSAIRPAASTIRDRSRSPSSRDLLDTTARVLSSSEKGVDPDDGGPSVAYTVRPYPSAGASYELELYLAVDRCQGLARGFYHYDAGAHALVPIGARTQELEALLRGPNLQWMRPAAPQVLITIAARFGRVSWKYSSLAYALVLKDVGVLTQTLYLMATDMGLGGCAIGISNIDLFARMTGLEFHVEGPVGQFALGRALPVGGFRLTT